MEYVVAVGIIAVVAFLVIKSKSKRNTGTGTGGGGSVKPPGNSQQQ